MCACVCVRACVRVCPCVHLTLCVHTHVGRENCEGYCLNGGTCVAGGTCVCTEDWTGEQCENCKEGREGGVVEGGRSLREEGVGTGMAGNGNDGEYVC